MVSPGLVLFSVLAVEHIVLLFLLLWMKSYNIPVAVLRYTGGKQRPTLIVTKAKKYVRRGVPRLKVRGYKEEFRDYLSENYYPAVRSKWGGLVLWEFEDNLLTPVVPSKKIRKLGAEQRAALDKALQRLTSLSGIKFDFNKELYHELRLKAVDDVDNEFMLQEDARIDTQYAGGWRDFIAKYSGHMVVIIIAILMVVGLSLWLEKMPEFAAQCYGAAQSSLEQGFLERAGDALSPPA